MADASDAYYYDDEPEDDGRPQLPRKPRYYEPEPTGPRLTFAHEQAQAADGIYVSPPQPPERLGADLKAWGADAGKAAIAASAAARDAERQRQAEDSAHWKKWAPDVWSVPVAPAANAATVPTQAVQPSTESGPDKLSLRQIRHAAHEAVRDLVRGEGPKDKDDYLRRPDKAQKKQRGEEAKSELLKRVDETVEEGILRTLKEKIERHPENARRMEKRMKPWSDSVRAATARSREAAEDPDRAELRWLHEAVIGIVRVELDTDGPALGGHRLPTGCNFRQPAEPHAHPKASISKAPAIHEGQIRLHSRRTLGGQNVAWPVCVTPPPPEICTAAVMGGGGP
jgi:hypothetical protein